jgi:hypothetical protein
MDRRRSETTRLMTNFRAGGVILFLISLLNLRATHNWGGDFSMYIHQAKNMIEGSAQTQNGYLYSTFTSYHGPQAYPVGLPLLLAPVYALFGNSIFHFEWVIAISAFLFSLLTWRYLSQITKNTFVGLTLTLLIALNPWFIEFKGNILSDIPFSAFVIGIILLANSKNKIDAKRAAVLGLLTGYALLIRSAGVALLGAFGLFFLLSFIKRDRENTVPLKSASIFFVSSIGLFWLFQYFLFPAPSVSSYSDSFDIFGMLRMVSKNADYYIQTTRDIIPNAGPVIFQTLLYFFLVVGIVSGFFIQSRKEFRFSECFALAYLSLLLLWPGLQGFRLLLPIAPLGLGYAFTALNTVCPTWTTGMGGKRSASIALAVTLLVFAHPVIETQKRRTTLVDGPQTPEAQEVFAFIRDQLPKEANITFHNPRVLALYSERNAIADPFGTPENEITRHFEKMRANYFLIDRRFTEDTVKSAINLAGTPVFENSRFELYKRR